MGVTNTIQPIYHFNPFTLDLGRGGLQKNGIEVPLRPKSFEVLRYLVEHHGQLASKEEMLTAIWGHEYASDDSLVQCMIDIRKALGDTQQSIIRTVPRRGYIFDVAVEMIDADTQLPTRQLEASSAQSGANKTPIYRQFGWIVTITSLLVLVVLGFYVLLDDGKTLLSLDTEIAQEAPANSIAVLPFVDLSPHADQSWLAEGISEEILNLLVQSPDLYVIARTSSFSFKERNLDIRLIAEQLGVKHILEGSVRKEGENLRITAQLINAQRGDHLWSQTYNRKLENVLNLQSEIAEAAAEALHVHLNIQPLLSTSNPKAYEAFLQAEFFYNRRNEGDMQRALEYYQMSVALDPEFAHPWIGLSGTYRVLSYEQSANRDEFEEAQLKAAKRGLELAPNLAKAHMRMAEAYYASNRFNLSDTEWKLAISLGPNDPYILSVLAGEAEQQLKFEKAVHLQARAASADPVSYVQRGNLAAYLFHAGLYEEALQEFKRVVEINPQKNVSRKSALSLALLGRSQDALSLQENIEVDLHRNQVLAMALSQQKKPKQADAALQSLINAEGVEAEIIRAQWYAWSGEIELAYEHLNRCILYFREDHRRLEIWNTIWLEALSPLFIDLRGDPRWTAWYEDLVSLSPN